MNDKNDIDVKKNAAALTLKNVSFSYKNTRVITDFSLSVAPGSFTTLLGASGCGKSLTLKSIAGIERPDEGYVNINGRILLDTNQKIDLKPQQRRVGYLFQNYALFPTMTVEENIAAGLTGKKAEKMVVWGRQY